MMKEKILRLLSISLLVALLGATEVEAKEQNPFTEQVTIRCTCYTGDGITSTGCHTRHGIIAANPEWYGCVAILYTMDGDLIGYYEVLDTGAGFDTDGDGRRDSIKNGKSIDVWCENMAEVRAWQQTNGDYVQMQLVRCEG